MAARINPPAEDDNCAPRFSNIFARIIKTRRENLFEGHRGGDGKFPAKRAGPAGH